MIASGCRSTGRGRTALLAAGALALLVAGSAAPGTVRASCGDHVQFRLPPGANVESPAPAALPEHPAPPQPALPAKPCDGPHCSGGGAPPLVPPPAPTPTPDERWGQPAGPGAAPAPSRAERLLDSSSERPIHRKADVFHPPRLS